MVRVEIGRPDDMVRVEIGGGEKPLDNDWINVDRCAGADRVVDFDAIGMRLPFDDATVDAVYSSHCLEHVVNLRELLREIGRVCKPGATVEIRVPHWLSAMACCHGHVQVIPPEQVEHWCVSAIPYWWADCPRRLALLHTETIPSGAFDDTHRAFQWLTPEQLMRFVPGSAHEIIYRFIVVLNA